MLVAGIILAFGVSGQAPGVAGPAASPPQARGWEDFPVFVWREKYAGKPLPEELAEPFGGVILMREEDSSWARERGLSYLVWNVAGRDALHLDADEAWNARVERWIETHDEKLLVREPCLNDPETVERMLATLEATLAKHGDHPGLGFVLGDEVGLTPNGDPFDLCRCGFCETLWREYAKENGLPERAPLTDEVRLALLEGDDSKLEAWLARRRFERSQFTGLLLALVRRCRDYAPFHVTSSERFPVGLLGLGAPTAFGSIDLATCAKAFDFLESYPVADARETLLAFESLSLASHTGRTRSLATIFVDRETPDSAAWRGWEHWLRGGSGLVLWSDAALSERPRHRERLAQTVREIRLIQQRFPDLQQPGTSSVALVHDSDSVALSWLKDALLDGPTWPRRRPSFQARNGSRETKVIRWLTRLEDLGELPVSIPLELLDEQRWEFDVLVLPEVCVLAPENREQLEWHVQKRGTVVVDGTLGSVDRKGQPLEQNPLVGLRTAAPDSVVQGGSHDSALPERLMKELSEKRPTLLGEAATISWLVGWRSIKPYLCLNPPFETLLVLLPRLDRPEHHARLRNGLELELQPAPRSELERLYPPPGERLRPGDAAVYLTRWPVDEAK